MKKYGLFFKKTKQNNSYDVHISLPCQFTWKEIEWRAECGMNRDPSISQASYPMKLWLRQQCCGKQVCVMSLKRHGGQWFKVKLKKTASISFSQKWESKHGPRGEYLSEAAGEESLVRFQIWGINHFWQALDCSFKSPAMPGSCSLV